MKIITLLLYYKISVIITWSSVTTYIFKIKLLYMDSLTNAPGHWLATPYNYYKMILLHYCYHTIIKCVNTILF